MGWEYTPGEWLMVVLKASGWRQMTTTRDHQHHHQLSVNTAAAAAVDSFMLYSVYIYCTPCILLQLINVHRISKTRTLCVRSIMMWFHVQMQ